MKTQNDNNAIKEEFIAAMNGIAINAREDAKAKYPDMGDFYKVQLDGKHCTVWTVDEKQAVTVKARA